MKTVQVEIIYELKKKLETVFGKKALQPLEISSKQDNSVVTEIDFFVSHLIKEKLKIHSEYQHYSFFSEEEFDKLVFPCAILDPIDGTRELIKGRAECAISLGLMKSPLILDQKNYGWIYNPFSGFSLDSSTPFFPSNNKSSQKILGMVSRTEFEKGHFNNYLLKNDSKIDLTPRGSIAFKLGLLASGGCDFVLSLSPKNIWDIAGGTILCAQRGIKLYQNGIELKKLDQELIKGVLLWAPESIADMLLDQFKTAK